MSNESTEEVAIKQIKIPLPILETSITGWLILPCQISKSSKEYILNIINTYLAMIPEKSS